MSEKMPEAQRRPRHRNALGHYDRRLPFGKTTDALHGTPGGLSPPDSDGVLDYTQRDNNTSSPCGISGADYSGI